jgi:hypothetical protein
MTDEKNKVVNLSDETTQRELDGLTTFSGDGWFTKFAPHLLDADAAMKRAQVHVEMNESELDALFMEMPGGLEVRRQLLELVAKGEFPSMGAAFSASCNDPFFFRKRALKDIGLVSNPFTEIDSLTEFKGARESVLRKHIQGSWSHFSFRGVVNSIITEGLPTYPQLPDSAISDETHVVTKAHSSLTTALRNETNDRRVNLLVTGDMNRKPTYEEMREHILKNDSHKAHGLDVDKNPMVFVGDVHAGHPRVSSKCISTLVDVFLREMPIVSSVSPWLRFGNRQTQRDKVTMVKTIEGYVLKATPGPKQHGDRNAIQLVKPAKPHPLLKGLIQKTEK